MTYPHRPKRSTGVPATTGSRASAPWTVRPIGASGSGVTLDRPMRRYEILALDREGNLVDEVRAAPAHPVFDSTFTAIARGALVMTEAGPTAVEDLVPGMRVETRDAGYQTLMWRGSALMQPRIKEGVPLPGLYRITIESFGPQRPSPDLVLGPGARLVWRSPELIERIGTDAALLPIGVFDDSFNVVRIAPASPVRVFHLGFRRHHVIAVNGLEIETVHPGPDALARMGSEVARIYLSLFPHLAHLSDFGPLALPRLSREAAELLLHGG